MNDKPIPSNGDADFVNEESSSLQENIKSRSIWSRLFFMIVVTFLYSVSRVVLGAVIVMQFFWVLFTADKNSHLLALGHSLSTYTYQVTLYLTFNTEDRPFPLDLEWPNSK